MKLDKQDWQSYAKFHGSVTTSLQLEIYRASATYLYGDVIDCGCGSAKIAPLLADQNNINSYLGVDCSSEMVGVANYVVEQLGNDNFQIQLSRIEEVKGQFDSAVSIQSFYAWQDPALVLKNIYQILKPGGVFVLATPNNNLDIDLLLSEAFKENICHPHFSEFENHNKQIASQKINSIEMSDLLTLTKSVGFSVIECHQKFLKGGLCLAVLKKVV